MEIVQDKRPIGKVFTFNKIVKIKINLFDGR